MIIYKIQESGQATDFQHAKKCPDGWESIDGDKIPEDISIYHEQNYVDSQALETQNKTLIGLIRDNEYHLISRRFVADIEQWETALDKWAEQLEANEITEIYPKPF